MKEDKVVYYDDGSTIVDMSCIDDSRKRKKDNKKIYTTTKTIKSTPKEKMNTFFQAWKLMLLPTAIVLGILFILFLFFYLITR